MLDTAGFPKGFPWTAILNSSSGHTTKVSKVLPPSKRMIKNSSRMCASVRGYTLKTNLIFPAQSFTAGVISANDGLQSNECREIRSDQLE